MNQSRNLPEQQISRSYTAICSTRSDGFCVESGDEAKSDVFTGIVGAIASDCATAPPDAPAGRMLVIT
jgi:hypothetical protein